MTHLTKFANERAFRRPVARMQLCMNRPLAKSQVPRHVVQSERNVLCSEACWVARAGPWLL